MIIIAAVDKNWGIGKDNDLLYHIKEDMKFFRSKTKDNIIIIGRKTLESFPDAKPLKNRINLVLTTNKNYKADKDAIILTSIGEIFEYIKNYPEKDVYVCGGANIYNELLPYCETALITKINDEKDAQKYMPNLDNNPDWEMSEISETLYEDDLSFNFCTYKNKRTKKWS